MLSNTITQTFFAEESDFRITYVKRNEEKVKISSFKITLDVRYEIIETKTEHVYYKYL